MVRAAKSSTRSFIVNQRVAVRVTPVPFTPLATLDALDVGRLKRAARKRIEVGYFESECCRRMVYAIVRKGMVVKLELDPCEGEVQTTPETEQVIKSALARMRAGKGGRKVLPVPVERFMANAPGLIIQIWGCIRICCFGYCLFCCYDLSSKLGAWGFCRIEKMGGTTP